MGNLSPELEAAYRATLFCASTPDRMVIRIGQVCPELDQLLKSATLNHWAFITASNPESSPLPDRVNAARHQSLLNDVQYYQPRVYPGEGIPDGGDWPAEISLLVVGIDRPTALALGRKYRQHAIVVGSQGHPASLLFCGD